MKEHLIALLFGTLVGVFVQLVASTLHYNEQWESISLRKKIALAAAGGIAALAAGLWVLWGATVETPLLPNYIYYKLWFLQIPAAWAGAIFMDKISTAQLKLTGPMKGKQQ